MNKRNQRAFTLIEMLVVVVILGILLAIAIPSVRNLMNQNKNKMYQTHMSVVEAKTKLLVDHYKGELLSNSASCFLVDYQDLLTNEWITEQDIHCEGSIILTKSGNQRNFTTDYYLNCFDNSYHSLNKSDTVPSGCMRFQISR